MYKLRKFSYCTHGKSGLDIGAATAPCRMQTKKKRQGKNDTFTSFSRKTNNNV